MSAIVVRLNTGPVIKLRDRDAALANLIPKMLGILAVHGQRLPGLGECAVRLTDQTELSASFIDADRIMLSAYHPKDGSPVKVFSSHVTDLPIQGDPSFYRYHGGKVGIMSWRRGTWEDCVMREPEDSMSVVAAFASGFLRLRAAPCQ